MSDCVIIGTDTGVGKTTFAGIWLAWFAKDYDYWKPVESGDSDTAQMSAWLPGVRTHPPIAQFSDAVAPLLAARREHRAVPSAEAIAAAVPRTRRALAIETFGSPFSPLDESELQIALLQRLARPLILVSSTALGAIGRTLQALRALETEDLLPCATVLIGPEDRFAEEQIRRHWPVGGVFSFEFPDSWDGDGFYRAASSGSSRLAGLRELLEKQTATASTTTMRRPLSHETTANLVSADAARIWHPYSPPRTEAPPLVCVAAEDEFLYLADGSEMIDAISSWWTILHGHRPPFLVQALRQALSAIDHVHFAGVTHAWAIDLAGLLLASLGWTSGRVFYSDNGSTAVEVALKLAFEYWRRRGETGRQCFVGFQGGYHGDTFGAMAVSRDPIFFGAFEPLLCRAEIIPMTPTVLDETLARLGNEAAAVIVEPLVQGAGGMRMHTPELLRQIWNTAKAHGVLFIADEVMTGGGRTGPLWAFQSAEIEPDLICAAKTLAGGLLPLAATLISSSVVEAFTGNEVGRFYHGHSFTGHPLACAVAAANWRRLTTESRHAAERIAAFWRQTLTPLAGRGRVRDVRLCGTITALEFDFPGGYLAQNLAPAVERAAQLGVLVRPLGNVLYAMPPLCTRTESLERIAEAFHEAVHITAR
jgi:adenosylmethionine-8-amino-7-oxononanoate aminotransferase